MHPRGLVEADAVAMHSATSDVDSVPSDLARDAICRYSIHSTAKDKSQQRTAEQMYPRNIDGLADVYHCGFHDEKSFGCASYLVVQPEGNVLIDVPRYVPKLVKQIQVLF